MGRSKVERTAPGEGVIAVQVPLVSMMEASVGVDAYIRLVRSGRLDGAGRRTHKFRSSPDAVKFFQCTDPELPDGLPELEGDVTWRRVPRHWSLDAHEVNLGTGVEYRSQIRKGVAMLRIQGVRLPDTLLDSLPGRPLRDVFEHAHFADPGILILAAHSRDAVPAGPSPFSRDAPASTTFELEVPTLTVPDPFIPSKEEDA